MSEEIEECPSCGFGALCPDKFHTRPSPSEEALRLAATDIQNACLKHVAGGTVIPNHLLLPLFAALSSSAPVSEDKESVCGVDEPCYCPMFGLPKHKESNL